jgi:hypothetical protein
MRWKELPLRPDSKKMAAVNLSFSFRTPSTAIPGTIIKIQEIKIYNWLKRKRKGDGRGNRL